MRQDVESANSPRPYAGGTISHTTVYNCANSIIAAFSIRIKGRFWGLCLYICGVG